MEILTHLYSVYTMPTIFEKQGQQYVPKSSLLSALLVQKFYPKLSFKTTKVGDVRTDLGRSAVFILIVVLNISKIMLYHFI